MTINACDSSCGCGDNDTPLPYLCVIVADDFFSDDLAFRWSQRSGSWAISGSSLNTNSSSGLIVNNIAAPSSATGGHVTGAITLAHNGDQGRLVLGYSSDSAYWFAEVSPGATDGTLKLFERAGGANTQKGDAATIPGFQAGDTVDVCLSIGEGLAVAMARATGGSGEFAETHTGASPSMGSTKAGFGTGTLASGGAEFRGFVFRKHHADDSRCSKCANELPFCCDGSDASDTLTLTVRNIGGGGCSTCHYNALPQTVALTGALPAWGWTNTSSPHDPAQNLFCTVLEASLHCDGSGNWAFGLGATTGGDDKTWPADVLSCNPLHVFMRIPLTGTDASLFCAETGTPAPHGTSDPDVLEIEITE